MALKFFEAPKSYAEKPLKKQWKEDTPSYLQQVADTIAAIEDFTSENLETGIKAWITESDLSFGKVMGPLQPCSLVPFRLRRHAIVCHSGVTNRHHG